MSDVWPLGTGRNAEGEMTIGGVSVVDIVRDHGTPVYIYDETTLRANMRAVRDAFTAALPTECSWTWDPLVTPM